LYITIELPNRSRPGEGVTLDLCSEISRDLSAALDVADAIPVAYRLEIGSPGLDRALYTPADYHRFRGQLAKFKLKHPMNGQFVVQGVLFGVDDAGRVVLSTDQGEISIESTEVDSARLVLDVKTVGFGGSKKGSGRKRARAMGRR
jgi:ribosome maturation factor RimP